MKTIPFSMLLVLTMAFSAYADSVIRIQCEDDDLGTEVFINDKFVGECPVDAQVPAGTNLLRARKILDNGDYEKVFEKQLRLGEGAAQRVELVMSNPRLTPEGKARKEAAEAATILKQAESGDIAAMHKIAELYDTGIGVKKAPATATMWRNRVESTKAQAELAAAEAGNIEAMRGIATRYEKGLGVDKDPGQAQAWRDRVDAATRRKAAQEEEARRRKIEREEAEKNAQAARARAEMRKKQLDNFTFFKDTKRAFDDASKSLDNHGLLALPLGITLFPIATAVGLVSDAISAPTRTDDLNKLKQEAALRPSTWGRPDSMIAKATGRLSTRN